MAELTITEALAQLKVIDSRIANQQANIQTYLVRPEDRKDPLEKDGGSPKYIKEQLQSINDLQLRKVKIRREIAKANESTQVVIPTSNGNQHVRSIAEWLTWRKEIAPMQKSFNAQLRQKIETARNQATKSGSSLSSAETAKTGDIVCNVSEVELNKSVQELDEILQLLDGQLSLKNATVKIEV